MRKAIEKSQQTTLQHYELVHIFGALILISPTVQNWKKKSNSGWIKEILEQKDIRIPQLAKITTLFPRTRKKGDYLTVQKEMETRKTCTVILKMPRKMLIYFRISFVQCYNVGKHQKL